MDYVVTCVQQDTGAECAMCVPVRCGLCVCGCDVPPGASGSRSEPRLPRGPRRGALARERPRRVCARARLQGAPAGAASRGGCARLAADFRSLPGLLCPTAPRSAAGEARRAGRTGAPVPALSARGALGTPGSRGVRPCAAAAGAGRGGGGEKRPGTELGRGGAAGGLRDRPEGRGPPAAKRVPRVAARGGTRAPPPARAWAKKAGSCRQVWTLPVPTQESETGIQKVVLKGSRVNEGSSASRKWC